MTVDVGKIVYTVELWTETGTVYDLTGVTLSMDWEEFPGELSQRGNFVFANGVLGDGWLHERAKIGCFILLYGDWGLGRSLLYRGRIWQWNYGSSVEKELSLVTYDGSRYLNQSKDSYYFSAGMDTASMLQSICSDWGIPLDYHWAQSMTHEKKVFSNMTLGAMLLSLLEEVSAHCGESYVCLWKDECLSIGAVGENALVYQLDTSSTVSTAHRVSGEDLVTRVKVLGVADDEGRSAVEAVVEGDLDFGLLQEVIVRESDKSLEACIAEAETYLGEHGTPWEEVTVEAVDLPFLRKGDYLALRGGNLLDTFSVLGVCHHGHSRRMTLTLQRVAVS